MKKQVAVTQAIIFGMMSLMGSGKAVASSEREFIWDNKSGIVSSGSCAVGAETEVDFSIVKSPNQPYENLRSHGRQILGRIVNNSLVKSVSAAELTNYEPIEITGVHVEPGLDIKGDVAQRNEQGYVYEKSILPLKDFVIQITEEPVLENDQKFDKIASLGVGIVGSFLKPVVENFKYVTYDCDGNKFVVFDLFVAGTKGTVARVGVSVEETKIFKNIRVFPKSNGQIEIDKAATASVGVNPLVATGNLFRKVGEGVVAGLASGAESTTVAIDAATTANSEEEEEEDVEADDGIDHSQSDADAPQGGEVPVFDGTLEFRVCIDNGPLNVRQLDSKGAIDMSVVSFKVDRFSVAKPVQGFSGSNVKTQEVNGKSMEFMQVQFSGISGNNVGWVAKDLIVPASHCSGYQKSLGNQQPIVCIGSGDLNVFDLNSSNQFVKAEFRASQFEEVAFNADSSKRPRNRVVDGKTLEYINVIFPNRNNEDGWVAKGFISTKAKCEAFKTQGSSSGSVPSVKGWLFPSPGRPTASYVKDGPGAGKKWFGAKRSSTRLHAACDLFRPFKDKVQAVENSKIVRGPYYFYLGTYAIEARNTDGKIVRYGEVTAKRLTNSDNLNKGDTFSTVARNTSRAKSSMLHLELYSGKATGSLNGGGKYKRRSDLMNPTETLRTAERARFGKSY